MAILNDIYSTLAVSYSCNNSIPKIICRHIIVRRTASATSFKTVFIKLSTNQREIPYKFYPLHYLNNTLSGRIQMSVLNSLKLKHSYHKIYFKELICLGIMFTLVKEEEEKEEEEEEEETKQKTIKLASTF
jgi:hypothetical protein